MNSSSSLNPNFSSSSSKTANPNYFRNLSKPNLNSSLSCGITIISRQRLRRLEGFVDNMVKLKKEVSPCVIVVDTVN
ncbi:unnamed protein product [Lathyrus oleraceus]